MACLLSSIRNSPGREKAKSAREVGDGDGDGAELDTSNQTGAEVIASLQGLGAESATQFANDPVDEDEERALVEMRAGMREELEDPLVNDLALLRYLRAYVLDVDAASAALRATIKWRKGGKRGRMCPRCSKRADSHSMRIVGEDPAGRPVIYTCYSTAMDRWDAKGNENHLSYVAERTQVIQDRRGRSHQWVIVADFHGFGLRDCNPQSAVLAARALAHYPERLGTVVILDPPAAFAATWKLVRLILNQKTISKVKFVNSAQAGSAFEALGLGQELSEWLSMEMRQNRSAEGSTLSRWWLPPSEQQQGEGGEDGGEEGGSKPHDKRGTKSLLQDPELSFMLQEWTEQFGGEA